MRDEYKTTVISYDERKHDVDTAKVEDKKEPGIQNVLFNVTTKVPHPVETLPTTVVEVEKPEKKIDLRSAEKVNKHADAIPAFYKKELHRSRRIMYAWIGILAICVGLCIWALVAIFKAFDDSKRWLSLLLLAPLGSCIAMLIVYANNYINFRNEARNVDFTKEKVITTSVMKLYKRLKTAHINVNWFCGLTYAAGTLVILLTYIVMLAINHNWGQLNTAAWIAVGVASAALIVAFIMHIVLLVTNYVRAGKIDSFYSVQIVSDEELEALKKKKNKRDLIIFLAVICIIFLIGLLIYRLVKSKKAETNITVNNGPSATIGK